MHVVFAHDFEMQLGTTLVGFAGPDGAGTCGFSLPRICSQCGNPLVREGGRQNGDPPGRRL